MQPAPEDLRAAFNAGARILAGLPACVRTDDSTWVLDVSAAVRGNPQPYHGIRRHGPVHELIGASYRTLCIDGREITGLDVHRIDQIVATMPPEDQRHAADADARRLEAGRIALGIRDAHARASVLSAVDGWTAISEVSELIDSDPVEGDLYAPLPEMTSCVLVLRCPSTGRTYAHLVPGTLTTARAARRWFMRLPKDAPDFDVST